MESTEGNLDTTVQLPDDDFNQSVRSSVNKSKLSLASPKKKISNANFKTPARNDDSPNQDGGNSDYGGGQTQKSKKLLPGDSSTFLTGLVRDNTAALSQTPNQTHTRIKRFGSTNKHHTNVSSPWNGNSEQKLKPSPRGVTDLLQREQMMLQKLLFQEQAKYRDAINREQRRLEMQAHAQFESFRLQKEFGSAIKQKQQEFNSQKQSVLKIRLKEKEHHDREVHENIQKHLEQLRNVERADSAEKKARKDDQLTWFKAKVSIQHQSEQLTKKKQYRMIGHIETSIEKKQRKLEEINQKREEHIKSREVQERVKSAVKQHQKEAHYERVKSRGGSMVDTKRSHAEINLKNKQEKHQKVVQELQQQQSEEDLMRRSLSNLRQSMVIKNGQQNLQRKQETVKKNLEDQEIKVSLLLEKLKIEQEKRNIQKSIIDGTKLRQVENFLREQDGNREQQKLNQAMYDQETQNIQQQRERIRTQVKEIKRHYEFLKQEQIKELRYSSKASRQFAKKVKAKTTNNSSRIEHNPNQNEDGENNLMEDSSPDTRA